MQLMARLVTVFVSLALVLPAAAAEYNPVGLWEIEFRDSRYEVTLCGDDGLALCGKLIWLGNGADNADNMPYLNTYVINRAVRTGINSWNGELSLYGQHASGTIDLISDDTFITKACILLVVCREIKFFRIQ